MDTDWLNPTPLLDFGHETLARLVRERRWLALPERDRIGAVYDFVRDEIQFGYNASDDVPASLVLADGYGQCNTKTTLLLALLRAVGVPCRFHGATIHKRLQRGVVTGVFYRLAPTYIIHSWAEVLFDGRWVSLEGVILDRPYLDGLRRFQPTTTGPLVGYAVGTDDLAAPTIEWRGDDTAIQMAGVNKDFGVYDDPDAFYAQHGANMSGLRAWLFKTLVRRLMNRRVGTIRACAQPAVNVPT